MTSIKGKLRSAEWFDSQTEEGFRHSTVLMTLGIDPAHAIGKPIIAICNPASELNNCEMGLNDLVPAIKRGVSEAGGIPLVFSTMPLGAELLKPSDLLYRNLVSMEIEETLRAYPIDGVILLCNCDKTTPAQLMAAASADLPAIQLSGGPKAAARWNGQLVSSGTDTWRVWDDYRAGKLSTAEWDRFQQCRSCSYGACNEMGTTSTMTAISEALGMMPSGASSLPANDARRKIAAENAGRRIVQMVSEGLTPGRILTQKAFENAIRVCMALGGSTNAILHLIAIAGRRGIALPLSLFDRISSETPVLANIKPSGAGLMSDFDDAGGLPALMQRLEGMLHLDSLTCSGKPLADHVRHAICVDGDIIRPIDRPITQLRTLAVLHGNLVPRGAVLKTSAASIELLKHTGPALVFAGYQDMLDRIDSPDLDVSPSHVLILKNVGPHGVPGMPEWGAIPIPAKLLKQGVRDMVRITDCRMSGTSFGTVILHATPEAAVGGTLGLVRDGDSIELDVTNRKLNLLVSDDEIAQRRRAWVAPGSKHLRGYLKLYEDHVLQADEGCDFDFLKPTSPQALRFVPPVVGRS